MRRILLATAALLVLSLGTAKAQDDGEQAALQLAGALAGIYHLDMSQSEVKFRIVDFGISSLSGTFTEASGELALEDAAAATNSIAVRTNAESAQMANQRFRRIMLGPAFFDAANHPVLTFEASGVPPTGGTIAGQMTMRGITAPIALQSTFNGVTTDEATGLPSLHYTAQTTIDRRDWGMTGYSWIAGTDVELFFDAVFVLEAPAPSVN